MAQPNWRDLLPSSAFSDQSRSDALQQLALIPASVDPQRLSTTSGGGTAAGDLDGSLKDVNGQLSALAAQITTLASAQQNQVTATQDNTQALTQNTSTKSGGSSIGSTLGGIATSFLGSGFGLSPIITGLMSLFGGGSGETPTALTRYQLPQPIDYQAGLSGSGQVGPVDYGQTGQVRPQTAAATSQVTVQVNAMDSKSFLDHSDEIANAVKAAILSSHSLNDVIADL